MIESAQQIAPEAVASHYDELDAFYREIWGDHVHHGLWITGEESRSAAVLQMARRVADETQIQSGQRVCDIGCGYGATARLLAAERGAHVTALTISPRQHAFARQVEPGALNPDYRLADWLDNDLEDAAFEAAIAIESSEHMGDKARFFSEAFRVLKPGGRLVVCAWLSAERPGANQKRFLLEPICREGRMPHLGTESEYGRMAAAAGFRLENFEDVSAKVERTWPLIVRRFVGQLLIRPDYVRFLVSRHSRNRVFGLTIVRLWLAYRTGAMRYGVFTFGR